MSSGYARKPIPDSIRWDVFNRDRFTCQDCGRQAGNGVALAIDHRIPVSRGGTNDRSNLRTVCTRCNSGKSNKLLYFDQPILHQQAEFRPNLSNTVNHAAHASTLEEVAFHGSQNTKARKVLSWKVAWLTIVVAIAGFFGPFALVADGIALFRDHEWGTFGILPTNLIVTFGSILLGGAWMDRNRTARTRMLVGGVAFTIAGSAAFAIAVQLFAKPAH